MSTSKQIQSTPASPTTSGATVQQILISKINRRGGTQTRAELDEGAIQDYAALVKDGAEFPPIELMYDGTEYWLWEGFHRTAAHEYLGLTEIEANVTSGTLEDAKWASLGANKKQGLRRQGADVKRVLAIVAEHPVWSKTGLLELSKHTGIPRNTISDQKIRRELESGERTVVPKGKTFDKYRRKQNEEALDEEMPVETKIESKPTGVRARTQDEDDESSEKGTSECGPLSSGNSARVPDSDELPSESGGLPWVDDGYEAKMREAIATLRTAYKQIAQATEYHSETKQMCNKWAKGSYSPAGILGTISALAKSIEKGLPVALSDESPGFITKARMELMQAGARKAG